MNQSPLQMPSQGGISPQTLIRGTSAEAQQPLLMYPTPVTERFFGSPSIHTAHGSVRSAYWLSWVGLVAIPCTLSGCVVPRMRFDDLVILVGGSLLWGVVLWANRGLRRGTRAAWRLQIGLSLLGMVFGSCFGILIYGYLLSQWFKPEVKAWFDLH